MKPFAYWKIPEFLIEILSSIGITLEYVLLGFGFGLIFGMLLALMKISHKKILRTIAYGYTTIMRCTPSIVLLFIVYYGLPRLSNDLFGIRMDTLERMKFVAITLAMFCTASISEVIRSSYEALDKTQIEAAESVGMTETQAFIHVLLPQMLFTATPNFCNTLLMLFKEGALAYSIGMIDLFGKGNYIIGMYQGSYAIEVYITLIIIYWPLSLVITFLSGLLENRFDYDNRQVKGKKVIKNA
jgi:L-cystine transport system permease protein